MGSEMCIRDRFNNPWRAPKGGSDTPSEGVSDPPFGALHGLLNSTIQEGPDSGTPDLGPWVWDPEIHDSGSGQTGSHLIHTLPREHGIWACIGQNGLGMGKTGLDTLRTKYSLLGSNLALPRFWVFHGFRGCQDLITPESLHRGSGLYLGLYWPIPCRMGLESLIAC